MEEEDRGFFEIVTRTLSDPSNNQVVVCAARKFLIGVCQVGMLVSSLRGFPPGTPDPVSSTANELD